MKLLTIDLEDWFHVYNFSGVISKDQWKYQKFRIVQNTKKMLDMLDKNSTKATFFVLGWVAHKFPYLINEIKVRGHEIGCHGYSHKPVYLMDKKEFEEDLLKAVKAIKKACGTVPKGYRAPSFSIVKKSFWALDILKKKGFLYDSSMVPVYHPDYGVRGISQKPFKIKGITEIPVTTFFGLPVGGCYFRVYPYMLSRFILNRMSHAVFYIHPWEIDKNMPKKKLPLFKKFRHYYCVNRNEKKFLRLLNDIEFKKIEDMFY